MIIKTAKLEGVALDWVVARVIGVELFTCGAGTLRSSNRAMPWAPSAAWSQGGPLIERNEIHVAPMNGRKAPRWVAMLQDVDAFGPTPLVAAMRAIVASDLGDTVDVPEELCK